MIRAGIVIGMIFAIAASGAGMARTANATLATPAKVSLVTSTINARVLAPAGCTNRAGLGTLSTNVFAATAGTVTGGTGNDLVLGRNTATTIRGGNGNDCLVGGAGADSLQGQGNTDVCLGNGSTDTFATCETQVQ